MIEIYIREKRTSEIRTGGTFLQLGRLITYIGNDQSVILSRDTPKTIADVKQLGDTAAHDRVYITQQSDIDDIKPRYRRLVRELLSLSGIKP